MKKLTIFLLCGLAIARSAQTPPKTFTSADGAFRFYYPELLVNCLQSPSSGSCMSQGTLCDGPGSEGTTLACFAYPNERFKDKPSFETALFYVSEIRPATTEKVCLMGSPNWLVTNSQAGTTTINHVTFKAFEIGDNWMNAGQDGPVYRTFHHGKCYELGIQTFTSRYPYDPGTVEEFTKQDWTEVESRLRVALDSFVFLK